ncbi:TonB-dependent receptor [Flavisolibacter sp. BT320]|nr:TonB-dependent receptor [Flavisolibacter longurius]
MRKCLRLRVHLLLLFALLSTLVFAQKQITGTVTDDKQSPLQGATVAVKGTKTVTTTDATGRFTLSVPANATTLVVSFVGMQPKEVPVGNNTVMAVALSSSANTMSDVVVIGYGTRRRAEVTSSISSVNAKDIKDMPVASVEQALQGKVAGVTITNNSGQPGGGVSVRVRGITTVNNNEPLYIVDGVMINGGGNSSNFAFNMLGGGGGQTVNSFLATLNPNDIESIDVLKDASAQAIYGSMAANGVVIITTKKGKVGEGKINYDVYYGTQTAPKKIKMMDLKEFARYQNEVSPIIGTQPAAEFANPDVLGRGTDWQDAIFQRGRVQNHQLSFSGGQNRTTYYVSGNYFDQKGILIGSGFKRYSMRFNLDQQVKTWFRAGISVNASKSQQKLTLADEQDGTITQALVQSPLIPVKNFDDTWGGPGTSVGGVIYYQDNPVAKSALRDVKVDQSQMLGNIYGELLFGKHLTLRNELAISFGLTQNTALQRAGMIGNTVYQSTLLENRSNNNWYAIRNYLNYNQTFGGDHHVSATAGHEASSSRYDYIQGQRYNLATNDLIALNAGDAAQQVLQGGKGHGAMESYFFRAGYTYSNRYSVNASYRADNSSTFGPNFKWGYFPAVSVGWTITNESFAQGLRGLNFAKLRVGYGAVGNQTPPAGAPNPPYTAGVRFTTNAFGAGNIVSNIANPNLKWESAVTQNIGLDLSILNRKVDITVDVYKKVTKDMLIFSSAPRYTGVGSNWDDIKAPIVNTGQMTNKGIDLSITTHNITKGSFSWKTTGIFSHYKNRLDKMVNDNLAIDGKIVYETILVTHTVQGHPVGSFFGLVTDGLYRTQDELNKSLPQFGLAVEEKGTWLGDIRFKDINSDGVIDAKDVTFLGNPQPKFTYGLTNAFNYKGFDASIFLQGSYGAKIFNWLRRNLEGMENQFYNQMETVSDRYSANNTDGSLPRFTHQNKNNTAVSDRWVEDGSYLRIQNVSIGYNLPKEWIRKASLNNVRLYVSGQNLYTFTKYKGYDPEIGAFNRGISLMNVDNGHYPNPRSITFGANVEF